MTLVGTKYTAYIFDFDFTLADATVGIMECMNHAFKTMGMESKSRDEIRKTVGFTLTESFAILSGIHDDAMANRFFSLFKEKANEVLTANTVLFAETIPVLTQLKARGCKTAIVTTKYRYRIDEVLSKYGIVDLIDYVVGFEDVKTAKPSPEGLLKAIEHFNIDKNKVLYIGDSLIDAHAAANSGVDFVAVTTGTTAASEFEPLPYIRIVADLNGVL